MTSILENLTAPEQIQQFTVKQQEQLAHELREVIIRQVAINGGHLASNLGVVELTIALLKACDFRQDRIVFDVGHQSYAWKILTGRLNQFTSLRQKKGLAGFPKRNESPYDFFDTGHSSTSISAALGMIRAMEQTGQQGRVYALIGDGAMTGGMAFEALNDAGMSGAPLVVILNDNQMSIGKNVGGLSKHLENLRISRRYIHLKTWAENIILRLPWAGTRLLKSLQRLKQLERTVFRRSGVLFEQLGFHYYGPVNGHDLNSLNRHLENIQAIQGPVLLHVLTQKGKGYSYAESSPDLYHGVAPFEIEHGVCAVGDPQCVNYSDVFGQAVLKAAGEDTRICAITAAMASGTGLKPFSEKYPSRFYDVGIAEQHAMTLAAGLAAGGAKPILAIYSTFLQRAYDQLLHDVCLQNLPVVIGIDRAGIVGEDGETHQGIYDLNLLLTLPNLEVICPADGSALQQAISYALLQNRPVAIRYPRGAASSVKCAFKDDQFDPQILRNGTDCTVVVLGTLINQALGAADDLAQTGIDCEIITVQRAKPLDLSVISKSIQKTRRLIVIEETVQSGSLGQWMVAELLKTKTVLTYKTVAIKDEPLHQGTRSQLLSDHFLDREGIVLQIKDLLS